MGIEIRFEQKWQRGTGTGLVKRHKIHKDSKTGDKERMVNLK